MNLWLLKDKKEKRLKAKKRTGDKQEKDKNKPFTIHSAAPAMFVCGLSADTDRNFNYLIREGK